MCVCVSECVFAVRSEVSCSGQCVCESTSVCVSVESHSE